MKKKTKILFTVLSAAFLLTACGHTDSSENSPTDIFTSNSTSASPDSTTSGGTASGGSVGGSSSTAPVEEEYAIIVQASSGVSYSLNKSKAKKGEEIILTLMPEDGFSVKSVIMNGVTELQGVNNVYTFTMPNRSVSIEVKLDVEGKVTVVGDVAAILTLEGNGIYAARNVKVDSSSDAYFSYQIEGENGSKTTLSSLELDETRCFANVTFSSSKALGELVIEGGCTYDFFYDPASIYSCYVIRTEVNYLPNNASTLYSLFEGTMRSESTVNYPDLKEIDYKITDIDNVMSFAFNYKLYENNTSFATIHDTLDLDGTDYYVYKNYDKDNELLTVVDTYTKAMGNNDRTRGDYNDYGAYSARYDVVSNTMDASRTQVNERNAVWMVKHSAHYGYEFEREFMYSYRVVSDSFNSKRVDIVSKKDDITGNIVTTIDTYTEDDEDAEVYDVEVVFDKAGRLLSLDLIKKLYTKDNWDYTNHAPGIGKTGRTTQKIECTYSYGEPFTGKPNFSTDPYFIQSFDELRFYDSRTKMPQNDDNSYLHYNDKINLTKSSGNDSLPYLNKLKFSPATAIDLWQYGPTASSDTNIITRQSTDTWNVMTCVGVGSATVTFSNHTQSSGITKDLAINVSATAKFHSVSIYSLWDSYPGSDDGKIVTSSTSANLVAGTQTSFKISVTPSDAPIIYEATSEKPDLLKVVETGEKLTLDTTGAANITTATQVRVRITSDWFQEESSKQTMFIFTIIPASVNPVGSTWEMVDYEDSVQLVFTDNVYAGGDTYEGYIEDKDSSYDIRIDFSYSYKNGVVSARVVSISFTNGNPDGWSTDPTDYEIDFYYDAEHDQMGVFFAEKVYDSEYEGMIYSPLYGDCDDGIIVAYTAFARA